MSIREWRGLALELSHRNSTASILGCQLCLVNLTNRCTKGEVVCKGLVFNSLPKCIDQTSPSKDLPEAFEDIIDVKGLAQYRIDYPPIIGRDSVLKRAECVDVRPGNEVGTR